MNRYVQNFSQLHTVLGLNDRNLSYVKKYNSFQSKKIADNKILTKKILESNGIETPKLIGTIRSINKFNKYKFNRLPGSVVVKPKKGFGGEGIVIFFSKDKYGSWVKADKTRYSTSNIKNHVLGILEGNYSFRNVPDTAFFEERVLIHPELKKYSYRGVPDIRIIVFNNVPVMAMLRVATSESDGKANVHAGGVGIGIDISRGVTTFAIQHDRIIETHPDFGTMLRGVRIPHWSKILDIAVKAQKITGIGFLGVDIMIDRNRGPLVAELNARPGLSIQIANNEGLKGRLSRVEGIKIKSVKRGIEVGKNLFGGEIEDEIEGVSGKQLIGFVEVAKLVNEDGEGVEIKVRNDSGAYWSTIDSEIAVVLGFKGVLDDFEEFKKNNVFKTYIQGQKVKSKAQDYFANHKLIRDVALVKQSSGFELRPVVELDLEMSKIKQKAKFSITKRGMMLYRGIIGRRELRNHYLIDPERKFIA